MRLFAGVRTFVHLSYIEEIWDENENEKEKKEEKRKRKRCITT